MGIEPCGAIVIWTGYATTADGHRGERPVLTGGEPVPLGESPRELELHLDAPGMVWQELLVRRHGG